MASFFQRFKFRYKQAGVGLLFLVAFLLLAYMMPRERKFTYQFQERSPWKEDNLIAPFSFSVLKTDAEYQAERDSVLKNVRLYFNYDGYQFAEQLSTFKERFAKEWIQYSVKNLKVSSEDEYLSSRKYAANRELQAYYDDFLYTLLEKVYHTGIVEIPEGVNTYLDMEDIILLRGNIAEEVTKDDLYTLKSAYEFVHNSLSEELAQNNNRELSNYSDFFRNFRVEDYITPNVFYNQEISEKERKTALDQISRKKGLIQQGTLIVESGEIITPQIYQVLYSLKVAYSDNTSNVNWLLVLAGKLIFVVFALILIYVFLYNFRRELLRDTSKIAFILFMVVLMVFVASATARGDKVSFYIIPFTILPIILRTFFDERVAVFVHVLTTLIIGIIAPNSYEFIVLNILAGIVAIFSLTNLYRRSRFFISALLVVITYCLAYVGIQLINSGTIDKDLSYFANFGINGVLILISFLLIYVFERVFGFLSDTSLMELADTNQALLRKLAEIAPGTFQHSMQVASLSEEAIYRIGGNPLLVRTGALYHDIGKMYDPIYFIENQASGINPHDNLEFEESAEVIINHVQKGIELAHKNRLPEAIIDFIRTHHGTTTVQYFYRSYIKKYPEQDVDIHKFTYPGPKPFSKEMAVLMMADSVEAASRSLSDYSEETISKLVHAIIDSQLKEEQFENAPITFRDIATVKEVFITRLKNIYHARITYPGQN